MLLPRRLMPSIPELVAFEAAARHENFSAAAEELCLTQGAISKQIRNIEITLGVSLFERRRKQIVLTRQGRAILPEVVQILQQIAATTYRVLSTRDDVGTIDIALFSTFASRWFMPRLPRFLARHPKLQINVRTVFEPFSFEDIPCDVTIHYGQPVWPNGRLNHLFDEELVAVCSPAYRDRLGLHSVQDLSRAALIQLSTRPAVWEYWFDSVSVVHDNPFCGHVFDQFNATIDAAMLGLGMALVPSIFVQRELEDGSLCRPVANNIAGQGAYYVVTPTEKSHDSAVDAVVKWIMAEADSPAGSASGS
jgi:LysR family transcriptional regulator, glycine cleavage system transcriptional activator